MAKISRPIIYAALLGVAAYVGVVLTEPTPPPKKKKPAATAKTTKTSDGITAADLNAHFERYQPKVARDPFTPRVLTAKALAGTPAINAALTKAAGNWVLTGITAINGTKSALLENSAASDSVFLKAGDRWNGLRVTAVGDATITLVDASGQQTSLGFPDPATEDKPATGTNLPGGLNIPGNGTIPGGTVPPAPVTLPPGAPSRLASGPAGSVIGT